MALGFHLYPSRTEKLSPITPMVLRNSGRVGSRRFREERAVPEEGTALFLYIPPSNTVRDPCWVLLCDAKRNSEVPRSHLQQIFPLPTLYKYIMSNSIIYLYNCKDTNVKQHYMLCNCKVYNVDQHYDLYNVKNNNVD